MDHVIEKTRGKSAAQFYAISTMHFAITTRFNLSSIIIAQLLDHTELAA
jgi:hypothetical protein